VIVLKNVKVSSRLAVDALCCENPGIVAILGPNGAGKTTLLKAVAGLLPADGAIKIQGKELASFSSATLARAVSYLPATESHAFAFSVRDVILLGDLRADGTAERRCGELCEKLGIGHLLERQFSQLSSGEQKRAALARCLLTDAPILLLDEPLAQIDVAGGIAIEAMLRSLSEKLILITTHDPNFAARVAQQTILVANGKVADVGPTANIITAAKLSQLFAARVSLREQFAFD
jgi:iron complex transport system ATP-binding protein